MNPIQEVPQEVPAIRYEETVYEGLNDFVHGGGEKLLHIHIPSHEVIFDAKGHVFDDTSRRSITTPPNTTVPLNLVEKIVRVAKLKAEAKAAELELSKDLMSFDFEKISK